MPGPRRLLRAAALDALLLVVPPAGATVLAVGAAGAPSKYVPASRSAFPGWLAGPWHGLAAPPTTAVFTVVLVAMLGAYALILRRGERLRLGPVLAAAGAAHLALLLGPPLLSADVFGYLGYARLEVVHGLSPYRAGGASLGPDPVRPFVLWRDVRSAYGPLFTLGSFGLVGLGVPTGLWALKGLAAVASLGAAGLVAMAAAARGLAPGRAAALVALNPVLLVFAVGGAHNDLLVAVLVAGALALLGAGRERDAAAVAVLAAAIKVSALLVVPFVVLGARRRRRALVAAAATAAAVAMVSLAAFGPELSGMVGAVLEQQRLVATRSVPAQIAAALGLNGLPAGLRLVFSGTLVVAATLAVRAAWRGADAARAAGWTTIALLLTTAWLLPWYVVWLLPLAALARDRRLEGAALALTAYLVATRVPLLLG